MQTVVDRVAILRERYGSDSEKLKQVNDAFRVLQQADAYASAQRNAVNARTRSRSERELDGKLTELAIRAGEGQLKRMSAASEGDVKKQKIEETEAIKSEPPTSSGDEKVFEKLNVLLREESKYHRAVTVLFNIVKSTIERNQLDPTTVRMLSSSVDTATVVSSTSSITKPLANVNEDNRKAVTRVINLILATDDLVAVIDSGLVKAWSHSVIFRNSLFEVDNFNFVKRCKELIALVQEAKTISQSVDEADRWFNELVITIQTIAAKDVCKVVPGRLNDTKSTMTEIYKISRDLAFPQTFRDRVAELQKQFMSSLVY